MLKFLEQKETKITKGIITKIFVAFVFFCSQSAWLIRV